MPDLKWMREEALDAYRYAQQFGDVGLPGAEAMWDYILELEERLAKTAGQKEDEGGSE